MATTRKELLDSLRKISEHNANEESSEADLTDAIFEFERLAEHPAGADLIFWPEPGADNSHDGIANEVERWRLENGLPGFEKE